MKQHQKFLVFAVIALMIVNVIFIFMIWTGNRQETLHQVDQIHEQRLNRQMMFLSRQLDLSDTQQQAFEEAFNQHHRGNEQLNRRERQIRSEIHQALLDENSKKLDSLKSVGQSIYDDRTTAYILFADQLLNICRDDQKEKLIELMQRAGPPPGDLPKPIRKRRRAQDS